MAENLANGIRQTQEAAECEHHMAEREHRRRALKGGVISYHDSSISVPCVVRDFTDHGVKLSHDGEEIVPNHFVLSVPIDGLRVACEVRWRKDKQVGAVFVGEAQYSQRGKRPQVLSTQYETRTRPSILRK